MKVYTNISASSGSFGPVGIGIDQSYSGFALAALAGDLYQITVYTGRGKGVDRLLDLRAHLQERIAFYDTTFGIRDVAMEGYAPGSKFGREMAGELGGMVKTTLRDRLQFFPGGYPLIVPPGALKKYVTGKGTAAKQQMLLGVYKKWAVDLDDDNAADAFALAKIAEGSATLQYERDVLASLHREAV